VEKGVGESIPPDKGRELDRVVKRGRDDKMGRGRK